MLSGKDKESPNNALKHNIVDRKKQKEGRVDFKHITSELIGAKSLNFLQNLLQLCPYVSQLNHCYLS